MVCRILPLLSFLAAFPFIAFAQPVPPPSQAPVVRFERGGIAYVVAQPKSAIEKRIVGRLAAYLNEVLQATPEIAATLDDVPAGGQAVVLCNEAVAPPVPVNIPSGTDEAFTLVTAEVEGRRLIVAAGAAGKGLKRAVQRLVIASEQTPGALVFEGLDLHERPWIPAREWTICPWTPDAVRGCFTNPYADKRLNIYLYDDERLARYVEMFDWFGYSGAQLIDTCYTWAQFGSVEAAHDWQKRVAGHLRDNAQEASLWAWTAEFSGFGWNDPEAAYAPKEGVAAVEDPDVRRTFEKYYRAYAELAPDVDRFIAHFYDPGRLTEQADAFDYMRLLESMLREKNPAIQMGVDCWARGPDYFEALADSGFNHYLLLPTSSPEAFPPGSREALHQRAAELGLHVGIWGWYTTEYETDQLASMYVNASVIKDAYSRIGRAAEIHPVEYWSEMEAHHLNNIYSMYVAGQLLWDPDRDPHAALAELTSAVWGPNAGKEVYEALCLIEDVRSGPAWETYWWTRPEHRVGTENPAQDLQRAERASSVLARLESDRGYVPKIPLPFPPRNFVELMLPHLEQIRRYAQFRLDIEEVGRAAKEGVSSEGLAQMLDAAWKPVPEYGTWIGVFGNQELRAQKETILAVAEELGLLLPCADGLRYMEADRLLQMFRIMQTGVPGPLSFTPENHMGYFWPMDFVRDRFQKLVEDGVLVQEQGGAPYRLVDWADWAGLAARGDR
jgi:hypothetical protein